MESLQAVLSTGAVYRKSSIDDSELSSWRRSRQWQRRHCYSGQSNDHYNLQPLPELLSFHVNHSAELSPSVLCRMPKKPRQSSPLCNVGKNRAFHRSASGPQISTTGSVYAGARFSEAPSPKLLPLPPRHWLDGASAQCPAVCGEMTRQLKSVLRVK